ncbi:MAG: hypothetical protein AMXMBFR78_14130 [Rubrivivax sp.]|jgi:photosystem II stability/assembly factor-like uncharacterized protein
MRITLGLRRLLLPSLVALAGCGGGLVLSFGDGSWPVQLQVLAPTRIETGQDFSARPGGLDGYGGLFFVWDFGDDSGTVANAEVTYRYPRAGSYTIRLEVSDRWDSLQASLDVEVGAWSIVDGRPCTGTNGRGWCQLDAPGGSAAALDALWFFDTREGVARARDGSLWRSRDGGRSWSPAGVGMRAEFAPDGSGWDLRGGQLWQSRALDRNWQSLGTPGGSLLAAQFADRDVGWLRTRDCDGCAPRLYRTQDGARSWQAMTLPLGAEALHFVDRLQGLASDGRSAAWTTQDGGWSWTPSAVNFGGRGGSVQRIVFAGTQQGWMLVNDAAGKAWLLRSSDGGQSWTVPAPAPGARVSDLAFGDARRGWAVGEQGAIWATTDGGLNWQAQASGRTQTLRAVSALDGRTVWAAGDGGTLLASATGGR